MWKDLDHKLELQQRSGVSVFLGKFEGNSRTSFPREQDFGALSGDLANNTFVAQTGEKVEEAFVGSVKAAAITVGHKAKLVGFF